MPKKKKKCDKQIFTKKKTILQYIHNHDEQLNRNIQINKSTDTYY